MRFPIKTMPFPLSTSQTLMDVYSGDHQGEDCTLLATTSCTRPAAERRRATASWWESPTRDCPLIMRSSSPGVSLPSLRNKAGTWSCRVFLPWGQATCRGTWRHGQSDLADAKLAWIGTMGFALNKWLKKVPNEIIFIRRAIPPSSQGWDPSNLLCPL